MTIVTTLALCLVAAAPTDDVLLSFSSPTCVDCRSMEPTLRRLAASGRRVERIDVAARPEIARQFGVTSVPCFVLIAGGRSAGRIDGPASYDRLEQLYVAAKPPLTDRFTPPPPLNPSLAPTGNSPNDARNPALAAPSRPATQPPAASFANNPAARPATSPPNFAGPPGAGSGPNAPERPADFQPAMSSVPPAPPVTPPATVRGQSPRDFRGAEPNPVDARASAERALRSTVRLRVEDANGISLGTGTIIDVHDDEALIVTCGHLFRELRRGGRIWVELFVPGAGQPLPGQLLEFDLERDIALLSIRPPLAVQAARVAPAAYRPVAQQEVFSIGCDRGANPSIRASRVTTIDRYRGGPNIEVAGAPVVGRSGGGLFSADGLLIGVCNGADPKDDEGIYAGLATVQWLLEAIGQRRVFETSPTALAPAAMAAAPPGNLNPAPPTPDSYSSPNPAALAAGGAATGAAFAAADSAPASVSAPNAAPISPMPNYQLVGGTAGAAAVAATTAGHDDLEIICVVRSKTGGTDHQETILISRPTEELLQLLRRSARPTPPPAGPVIRGQSPR